MTLLEILGLLAIVIIIGFILIRGLKLFIGGLYGTVIGLIILLILFFALKGCMGI